MHFIETPYMLYQEQLDKLRSLASKVSVNYRPVPHRLWLPVPK
jgi:hypothetical protein